MAYDARYIANLVLDRAAEKGISLTNAEINKIVYFLHALYIAKFARPLIDAKIEAWDYGPVIREIYSEFKLYGVKYITKRAKKIDLATLKKVDVYEQMEDDDRNFLLPLIDRYARFGTSRLIGLSHEKGGPWDLVYNASGRSNPGMEISNELIREYFIRQTRH